MLMLPGAVCTASTSILAVKLHLKALMHSLTELNGPYLYVLYREHEEPVTLVAVRISSVFEVNGSYVLGEHVWPATLQG